MIIYKITNKINGKIYIGQTIRTLRERFNAHSSKNGSHTYIGRSIKAHGKENFLIEEIDKASDINELNKHKYYLN